MDKCLVVLVLLAGCGGSGKSSNSMCTHDSDCPVNQRCHGSACETANNNGTICSGGAPDCSDGQAKFYSSPHESGCYISDIPPGAFPDPGYDATAPSPCTMDNVVYCDNPGVNKCSFCIRKDAAIPEGCHLSP